VHIHGKQVRDEVQIGRRFDLEMLNSPRGGDDIVAIEERSDEEESFRESIQNSTPG
jgi:hypothetical protein